MGMACRITTGGDEPYRPRNKVDPVELHRRVERAIEAELSGETTEFKEVIAEMTACEELPSEDRALFWGRETIAEAMVLAVWKGQLATATLLVQMLETRIRTYLDKQLTPRIQYEMEHE